MTTLGIAGLATLGYLSNRSSKDHPPILEEFIPGQFKARVVPTYSKGKGPAYYDGARANSLYRVPNPSPQQVQECRNSQIDRICESRAASAAGSSSSTGGTGAIKAAISSKPPMQKETYRSGDQSFIQVSPTYQQMLYDRNPDTRYSASILYNLPEEKNLAAPFFPDKQQMIDIIQKPKIKENYPSGSSSSYNYPTTSSPSEYTKDQQRLAQFSHTSTALPQIASAIPAGTSGNDLPFSNMAQSSAGGNMDDGSDGPVVRMDRLMNVLLKSRNQGQGDFFRGDLAIANVQSTTDPNSFVMFRPSSKPYDLQSGALQVMGGFNNENSHNLAMLQMNGTMKTTFGGSVYNPPPNTPGGNVLNQQIQLNMGSDKTINQSCLGDYSVSNQTVPAMSVLPVTNFPG